MKQKEWLEKYMQSLIGQTIIEAGAKEDEEGVWPYFAFEVGDQKIECEISRDEEGNGPGFLFGLPLDII